MGKIFASPPGEDSRTSQLSLVDESIASTIGHVSFLFFFLPYLPVSLARGRGDTASVANLMHSHAPPGLWAEKDPEADLISHIYARIFNLWGRTATYAIGLGYPTALPRRIPIRERKSLFGIANCFRATRRTLNFNCAN